jgi:hypothetical protein
MTKFKTSVINKDDVEIDKLKSSESVVIEDVTPDYFIIQYKNGNAYVEKSNVKIRSEELKALKEYRKSNPLDFKAPEIKKEESLAAQETIDVSSQINDISEIDDKQKYEIDHIRYCAGKYRNEIMTGYVFSLLGTAAVTSTLYMKKSTPDDLDKVKLVSTIGYGLGIVGTILIIDSNKWMEKMYVGPDGFGIRYNF